MYDGINFVFFFTCCFLLSVIHHSDYEEKKPILWLSNRLILSDYNDIKTNKPFGFQDFSKKKLLFEEFQYLIYKRLFLF